MNMLANPTPNTANKLSLDYRGMRSPAPILALAKAVRELAGQPATLLIQADDTSFHLDLKSWARSAKAEIVSIEADAQQKHMVAKLNVNGQQSQPSSQSSDALPLPPKPIIAPTLYNPAATPLPAPIVHKDVDTKTDLRQQRSPSADAISVINEPTIAASSLQASAEPSVQRLNCRGMRCPLPILNVAKAAKAATPGQLIEIQTDDETFHLDLKSWARSAKAEVVSIQNEGGLYTALIRINSPGPSPAAAVAAKPVYALSSLGAANIDRAPATATQTTARLQPAPAVLAAAPTHAPAPMPQHGTTPTPQAQAQAQAQAAPLPLQSAPLRLDLRADDDQRLIARLRGLSTAALPSETCVEFVIDAKTQLPLLTQWVVDQHHHISQLHMHEVPARAAITLGAPRATAPEAASAPQPTPQPAQATAPQVQAPAPSSTRESTEDLQRPTAHHITHDDPELFLPLLLQAIGAAKRGEQVTICLSAWGVGLLCQPDQRPPLSASTQLKQPRGILAKWRTQRRIQRQLEMMLLDADAQGVRFLICPLSMECLGVSAQDLISLEHIQFEHCASPQTADAHRISL